MNSTPNQMSQWSDPSSITAIANVGVVVIYTGVTILIWLTTAKANKATWRALEADHRPYVGVTGCNFIPPSHLLAEVRIAADVENVGSVPAKRIEIDFEIKLPGIDDPLRIDVTGHVQIALFPGQEISIFTVLPEKHKGCIHSSNGELQIVVVTRYQGITNQEYTSYATYAYGGSEFGFSLVSGHFD